MDCDEGENNSLYGQIALLGRYHGGLTDKTITLLMKFDRQNNDHLTPSSTRQSYRSLSPNKKESPSGGSEKTLDEIFERFVGGEGTSSTDGPQTVFKNQEELP
jgi:hypothetical protein